MGHDHLIEVNIIVIKGKQIRNLENRPLKKGRPLYTTPLKTGSNELLNYIFKWTFVADVNFSVSVLQRFKVVSSKRNP